MHALADYIRVYDDALPAQLCASLVAGFEHAAEAQVRNGRELRTELSGSAWTEVDFGRMADEGMKNFFAMKIMQALERYNADVKLGIPVPMRRRFDRLILKRYRAGADERFQPHFDSIDAVAGRYMVFLWYLNDVAEGGETEFCDLGRKVEARTGRLLMFPPYWMYQHAGLPPRSGDKYILSTYLMF